VPVEAVFG